MSIPLPVSQARRGARETVRDAWECAGAAPLLGQHTDEVLHEYLGMTDAEIAALRQEGVIGTKR